MSTENPNPPTIGLGTTIELELQRLQQIERRYNALREVISDMFTVRDQFAKAWLTGLAASEECPIGTDLVAKACYAYADAMMAERAKK